MGAGATLPAVVWFARVYSEARGKRKGPMGQCKEEIGILGAKSGWIKPNLLIQI